MLFFPGSLLQREQGYEGRLRIKPAVFFLSYQLWGRFQVTSHMDGNPPHSKGAISKRLSQIMTRRVGGLGRLQTQGEVF